MFGIERKIKEDQVAQFDKSFNEFTMLNAACMRMHELGNHQRDVSAPTYTRYRTAYQQALADGERLKKPVTLLDEAAYLIHRLRDLTLNRVSTIRLLPVRD